MRSRQGFIPVAAKNGNYEKIRKVLGIKNVIFTHMEYAASTYRSFSDRTVARRTPIHFGWNCPAEE